MNEDDAEYMQEDDDSDFEYETDGGDNNVEQSADVENQYYTAKSLKEDNPEGALKAFRTVVDAETEKDDWGFKAVKKATKPLFLRLHKPTNCAQNLHQAVVIYKVCCDAQLLGEIYQQHFGL